MVVKVDLKHRRGAARAETFNFAQRETAVSGCFTGLDAEFLYAVFGNLSRTANLARQRATDLNVILTDGLGMDHRVERRHFPDVRDTQLQSIGKVEHARRIEIATLALHDKHQRQNRRAHHRILRKVTIDLRLHLRRKRRRLNAKINWLRQRLDIYDLRTHFDFYLGLCRGGPPWPPQSRLLTPGRPRRA